MKRLFSFALAIVCGSYAMAQDRDPRTFINDVMKQLNTGNVDDVIKLVGEAESEGKEVPTVVRQQLASVLAQKDRGDEAVQQVIKVLEPAYKKATEGKDPTELGNILMFADRTLRRVGKKDLADKWFNDSKSAVQALLKDDSFTSSDAAYLRVLSTEVGLLMEQDKQADAAKLMSSLVTRNEGLFAKSEKSDRDVQLILSTWTDSIPFLDEAGRERVLESVQGVAKTYTVAKPNLMQLNQLIGATRQYVFSVSDTNPDKADEALSKARAIFDEIKTEDEALKTNIERVAKSLDSLKNSIESSRRLLALIDKPAPALDAMAWVNGPEVNVDELKGKVVLLDFWAVWCGPCIATFPHLRHLNEEYGSKGLRIIGATRTYNYVWDNEADRAVGQKEEVELAVELEMLNKFMAKHELKHPSLVSPKQSNMQKDFGVSGIPHAVVIDQNGIVRLIKVGSGPKNAEAIEKKIKELLGA